MITLANRCYSICVRLHFPSNMRSILTYSITILMAGSAGSLIIDIDNLDFVENKNDLDKIINLIDEKIN